MADDVLGIFSGSFQSFRAVILDGGLALARHSAGGLLAPKLYLSLLFYRVSELIQTFLTVGDRLKLRLLLALLLG